MDDQVVQLDKNIAIIQTMLESLTNKVTDIQEDVKKQGEDRNRLYLLENKVQAVETKLSSLSEWQAEVNVERSLRKKTLTILGQNSKTLWIILASVIMVWWSSLDFFHSIKHDVVAPIIQKINHEDV